MYKAASWKPELIAYFNRPKYSLIFLALLTSSCSLTPHNNNLAKKALELPQQIGDWSQPSNKLTTQNNPAVYLNQLIASEQLNVLIAEALTANPSLQQTLLTLQIRQLEQQRTSGNRLPLIDAGIAGTRDEESDAVYSGSLTISWQADLWQKLADKSTAAARDVSAQRALYQSARDTLAAEVMKAWLGLIAQKHVIRIQQQRIHALQQNELFITQRYRNGLGNSEDLSSARSSISRARANLVEYQESLRQQKRSLQALSGRNKYETLNVTTHYPSVVLPLADLPEQTLKRRPDLQAAYLNIEAESLRSAAAYKDLLPSISFQAALLDSATSPGEALLSSPLWSLLGQLTAPLYQAGQLESTAEISDLSIATAYQGYRDTLLTAVTEVEDALGLEKALTQRQMHIEQALASSQNSLKQYQRSYRSGLASILELLIIEQNTYDLETERQNLIYLHLSNRINLGLALGLGVSE